jgi:hypothetical protein
MKRRHTIEAQNQKLRLTLHAFSWKGKNMKLEEVNTRTKEAVDFLVAALDSGHSEVLTAYLGAMAKFHTYSFGNIMLIARQKPDASRPRSVSVAVQRSGFRSPAHSQD